VPPLRDNTHSALLGLWVCGGMAAPVTRHTHLVVQA
jgi:hypothetical protein